MTWKTSSIRALTQTLKTNSAIIALLACASCSHGGPVPKWDGEIWPGKPELGGVVRTEDDGSIRVMAATDERFRKGAWISYADLTKVFAIIQSCKQWPKGMPMMSASEALKRLGPVIEDMEREEQLNSIDESDMDKQDLIQQISPGMNETPKE